MKQTKKEERNVSREEALSVCWKFLKKVYDRYMKFQFNSILNIAVTYNDAHYIEMIL